MEMKNWMKPQAIAEQFAANEYCSTCGEVKTHYNFTCDATGGLLGIVYVDSNGNGQLDYFSDERISLGYHNCGATHAADKDDEFISGWYLTGLDGGELATPVIIWKGDDGSNVHCTTNLSMETWEETKS